MNVKHRQIIVAGVSTAGKSTFSHHLIKKFHLEHIEIDFIIDAFESIYPELGITHNANTLVLHTKVCQNFAPFLFKMIDGLHESNYVIEGFRMPIEDVYKKYNASHQIFCFGYPNSTVEERLRACRKYDTENWTTTLSDEEMSKLLIFFIEESRREEKLCKDLGIPFFDTAENFLENIQAAVRLVK